jgi:hypothetical protein
MWWHTNKDEVAYIMYPKPSLKPYAPSSKKSSNKFEMSNASNNPFCKISRIKVKMNGTPMINKIILKNLFDSIFLEKDLKSLKSSSKFAIINSYLSFLAVTIC